MTAATALIEACVDGCDRPHEPQPCGERCAERGEHLVASCVENGGDPEECAERVREWLPDCLQRCEGGPRPPCGDRCASVAREAYSECVEGLPDGGDDVAAIDVDDSECREQAHEILRGCLAENCERDEPNCEERCDHRVREIYAHCLERSAERVRRCVEDGGDEAECIAAAEEHCRGAADEYRERCQDHCNGEDPPRQPPTCAERCANHAEALFDECVDAGGEEEECRAGAGEALEECVARCEGGGHDRPDACSLDCVEGAARILERCQSDPDHDPDACAEAAREYQERCQNFQDEHCTEELIALGVTDPAEPEFVRADSNFDGSVDMSDAVNTLNALFLGRGEIPCQDAADTNDDGTVDMADPVYQLNFNFLGGTQPPAPFPATGVDPTSDDLDCAAGSL